MGWLGCGSREAHTPVDQSGSREQEVPNVGGTGRRGLRGVTEILAGRNHFTLDPTCRNSLGNKQGFSWILFFQGNKWVASLKDSKTFTVCWFHATNGYTVSMGRNIYGFKLNSLSLKIFLQTGYQIVDDVNTIHSFNCFSPLLFFLLGKFWLSNFCYPPIICFGHQLSILATKYTCVPIHEMWLWRCMLNWVPRGHEFCYFGAVQNTTYLYSSTRI